VILAKTVKGYGLGEAGEGRNISHQQKKMNEKELREFRERFGVPISDEEVVQTPFYRPPPDSAETKYLLERRKALGGFLPSRELRAPKIEVPAIGAEFGELFKGLGHCRSLHDHGICALLAMLLRNSQNRQAHRADHSRRGAHVRHGRLFREIGIYSPKGQLYEPVDREALLIITKRKDGQILEEGITEAGAMSSFIAAGTAYANYGVSMIPFYIYYSMFGFQRIGDLMWLAGDIKAKGFLLGATAGRTTLNGEGLQHQDGHSQLAAASIPTLMAYDPAFAYEIAVIVQDGMRRMYQEGEDLFYYLSLYNENYAMPALPEGVEEGILKGLYKFRKGQDGKKHKAHLFGSGTIIRPGVARPGNPRGWIRCFRRRLERHKLQVAQDRSSTAAAGTCCIPPSRPESRTWRPCWKASGARSLPSRTTSSSSPTRSPRGSPVDWPRWAPTASAAATPARIFAASSRSTPNA
jgi:pyruvate dehydrogenase E1 component